MRAGARSSAQKKKKPVSGAIRATDAPLSV